MAFLPYGTHVRLRSRLLGTYLHADENGASVSLSPHRASLNTAWALEAVCLRYLPGTYLSLQSVAYGRYLVVSSLGNAQHGRVLLRQHIFYGQLDNVDALWLAIRVGDAADNEVLIRHCKYKWWHIGVAVQNPNNLSMHWIVETIPWRQQPPVLPVPVPDPYLRVCFPTRTIVYARAENHGGMINPTSWRTMDFGGRSVLNLRAELARCLEEANSSDITLYAWTGYDGPRIPLVVDLPSNTEAMVIGVLNTGSPGCLHGCVSQRRFRLQ